MDPTRRLLLPEPDDLWQGEGMLISMSRQGPMADGPGPVMPLPGRLGVVTRPRGGLVARLRLLLVLRNELPEPRPERKPGRFVHVV